MFKKILEWIDNNIIKKISKFNKYFAYYALGNIIAVICVVSIRTELGSLLAILIPISISVFKELVIDYMIRKVGKNNYQIMATALGGTTIAMILQIYQVYK